MIFILELKFGAWLLKVTYMPNVVVIESAIFFLSNEAILSFKHECACNDFYIDRDAIALVGFFTQEQIQMAIERYGASINTKLN
jgi:hypothetical protein